MTSTNVLHLITRFLGGGAETTTVNEIEALLNSEKEYRLHMGCGLEYNEERVAEIEALGVETICFDHLRHYSLYQTIPAVAQIVRYLRQNEIEIIHTHSTEAGIIGRWAGALARTPVVIHEIHGDPITDDRSTMLNTFVYAMERISAPLATRIIVKSENIREDFLERKIGSRDQYELIYHGVETEQFADASPAVLPGSEAALRLLFIGRLEDGKGLFDLLEAFGQIRQKHDVELLIAGEGPLASELDDEIESRRLSGHVRRLGYRADIPQVLAAADALVLPSYREGTPRVISEALAAGLPVISTNIAGIPEQVADGECGILIEPGDVAALVTALDDLLGSERLRTQMSEACPSRAANFDRDRAQKQIRELYRELS